MCQTFTECLGLMYALHSEPNLQKNYNFRNEFPLLSEWIQTKHSFCLVELLHQFLKRENFEEIIKSEFIFFHEAHNDQHCMTAAAFKNNIKPFLELSSLTTICRSGIIFLNDLIESNLFYLIQLLVSVLSHDFVEFRKYFIHLSYTGIQYYDSKNYFCNKAVNLAK